MAKSTSDEFEALVAEAATSLGTERADVDGGVTYTVGETAVVVVSGATAEFRLRADIAAAAARTPDAAPSQRGPDWVAFSPTTIDRFARDRVSAWFEFAVRQADASPIT